MFGRQQLLKLLRKLTRLTLLHVVTGKRLS